ncbi:MAG: hypothetical protein LBV62_03415 [Rickettsiales bacterium]|jgi:hypothetical protein|nr:hypothetical protein [Rickettsiales bacterium]
MENIFTRKNAIPLIGATISILALAAVGVGVFYPALLGPVTALVSLPVFLGVAAAFAATVFAVSAYKIYSNSQAKSVANGQPLAVPEANEQNLVAPGQPPVNDLDTINVQQTNADGPALN